MLWFHNVCVVSNTPNNGNPYKGLITCMRLLDVYFLLIERVMLANALTVLHKERLFDRLYYQDLLMSKYKGYSESNF